MSANIAALRKAEMKRNATSPAKGRTASDAVPGTVLPGWLARAVKGRKANDAYRVREHLTEAEMAKLLAALKAQPARSPRLADRPLDLPSWPARIGSLRSPLG